MTLVENADQDVRLSAHLAVLSRRVRLPSGASAHYATAGTSGPPVVLLHGGLVGSSGLAGWAAMAEDLGAAGFQVYCPDFPGFGFTDAGEAYRPGVVGHRDFLRDFVDSLCLDTFFLAGNSMGCLNAVNFTLAYPGRVRRLALVAGGVGDLVPATVIAGRDRRSPAEKPDLSGYDGTARSMRKILSSVVLDGTSIPEEVIELRVAAASFSAAAFQRHRQASTSAADEVAFSTRGRLDQLEIPTIYLYGRQDALIPVEARGHAQEDVLPNVQFFYPDRCGHQGQTDRPELFARVFTEFFRDGQVSAAGAIEAGVSTRRPVNPRLVAAG